MLSKYNQILDQKIRWYRWEGYICKVSGLTLECCDISPKVGELCKVITQKDQQSILCEVIGINGNNSILMPLDYTIGVGYGDRVIPCEKELSVSVGPFLQGKILSGYGKLLNGGMLPKGKERPIIAQGINPLDRPPIKEVFETGIKSIDGLLTCGKGQRVGIFAGSGVGKSTLLGSLARNSEADICVLALIGERGREVRSFIEESLGEEGLKKSVLVVATSDTSPIQRLKGVMTALTIAEYFRDEGKDVLFLCDSITRTAMAIREIGLSRKEPPTLRGYPPSLYPILSQLVERLGNNQNGSITGFFTVLVEGDDFNEPVSDTMRALLDGHIVLKRELAQRGHFPAIDLLGSASRLMNNIAMDEHKKLANHFRLLYSTYDKSQELINIGAYKHGSNLLIDESIQKNTAMNEFLIQGNESFRFNESLQFLIDALR